MIALRPMAEADYEQYLRSAIEDYAQDRSRNFNTPIEEERAEAAQGIVGLLTDGLHTEGHRLWAIVQDTGEAVGILWVGLDLERRHAFIYDIAVDAEHRGKGYGKRTLDLLEEELKPMGITRIGLNVFSDNTVAIDLYQKQGYRTTNFNMQKEL